jgi:hypothetical protein
MASDLHRLAPAAQAIAEAECNGIRPEHAPYWMSKGLRLGKAIGKLNERLAPLGLCVRTHGDPRGYTLRLHALEGAAPLAGNTWGGDEDGYGIACRKGG